MDFMYLKLDVHLGVCFLLCVRGEIMLPNNDPECHIFFFSINSSTIIQTLKKGISD